MGVNVRPKRTCRTDKFLQTNYVLAIRKANDLQIRKIPNKIPKNVKEALTGPDRNHWQAAMQSEYDSLIENATWKLCPLPDGRKAIGSQWVLDIKYTADGSIERYKARLVAMGNQMIHGIDYRETFSPVVRTESLRLILAAAAINDWDVHQVDFTTAFLNGKIENGIDVYMRQPQGFLDKDHRDWVCKLKKALYGMASSGRQWYIVLHDHLVSLGYKRCHKEYCIYVKTIIRDGETILIIVAVYVDDLAIASKDTRAIEELKKELCLKFKMKDLGELNMILKLNIKRNRKRKLIMISQEHYIRDLLVKYDLVDAPIATTPQDPTQILVPETKMTEKEILAQPFNYRGLVGSLQYLVRGSRPDIANAVRELGRFMSKYNVIHYTAAERVARYLKFTCAYGLVFDGTRNTGLNFHVYADASFARKEEGRRSVTGYCSILAGAAVSFRSCKQDHVTLSTCESELVACSEGVKETMWLRLLSEEIGFRPTEPTVVYCDNMSAINIIRNPIRHPSTKHIEIRQMYARERFENKDIDVKYCPTAKMLADMLTKALPRKQFETLRSQIGVLNLLDI